MTLFGEYNIEMAECYYELSEVEFESKFYLNSINLLLSAMEIVLGLGGNK